MPLEKLPTGTTQRRSQPLSVQPDSRERWGIAAAQMPVSAGQSSGENNGGATGHLTLGIKMSRNNAGAQLGQRGLGYAPVCSELVFIPPPDTEHLG